MNKKTHLSNLFTLLFTAVLTIVCLSACGGASENAPASQTESSKSETVESVQILGVEENSGEAAAPATEIPSVETSAPAAESSISEATDSVPEASVIETPAPVQESSISEATGSVPEATAIETPFPVQESSISETPAPTEGGYAIPALPSDESYADFPLDPDERINYIRALYYGYTQNKDAFESVETDNVTGYWKKSTADLRLVTVDNEIFGGQTLSAEYYFAQQDDLYNLYFVFAHNADYSVEYRIYLWENKVFRYIGPYEAEETTYNLDPPVAYNDAALSQLDNTLPDLIARGFRELHLYGYR